MKHPKKLLLKQILEYDDPDELLTELAAPHPPPEEDPDGRRNSSRKFRPVTRGNPNKVLPDKPESFDSFGD
jgi:hypothetical protein